LVLFVPYGDAPDLGAHLIMVLQRWQVQYLIVRRVKDRAGPTRECTRPINPCVAYQRTACRVTVCSKRLVLKSIIARSPAEIAADKCKPNRSISQLYDRPILSALQVA
jgi:hypothetical protein